ncbi:head GIN domain-containing protein [Nonlabens xiamenensis]|uniref:head GIN domain-containing protein n=1 Tax=Nonlabens xiamenensis TaxID=2341043 RepID=UPI000F609262|nr:head GIN domain-containing protein [Nonlabens xiamenensis]
MKLILSLVFLAFFQLLPAQNPREINVADFDTIKVFDLITVNLVKSDESKIVITGQDAEDVEFVQKNELLKIRMKSDKIFDGEETFVHVYYKSLKTIDGNEGAVILSNELFEQDRLEVRVQEGARVTAGMAVKNLQVRAVTGGIVELSGVSESQVIVANTGGIVENQNLKTDYTKVKVQAGGEVEVFASDEVDVYVRAGGEVDVYGHPKKVSKKSILGGDIHIHE